MLCNALARIRFSLFISSEELLSCLGVTVFEKTKQREGDKRKKLKNDDPADIDGYLGPWGKYVDEKTVMKPSEVCQIFAFLVN